MHHAVEPYRATRTVSAQPCPGSCNARWRRAEEHQAKAGEPHDVLPRAGEPVWCVRCTGDIRTALGDMPELAARLQLEIENGTDGGGEHVSGSKERPLHQRQIPARLIEEICHSLTEWETNVREFRHLSARRLRRSQGTAISDSTRFLRAHFEWLMESHDPAATEAFGQEILSLFRRAQRVTKTDDPRPVACAGVPCRNCDMVALEKELHTDGSETGYIRCRYCPNLLNADEYERWTKMLAAPHRKRATA